MAGLLPSLQTGAAHLIRLRAAGHLGWARGAVGAGLGIMAAAAITALLLGANHAALPLLVAPVGASAVLVFAVPASPLAQPWPVIGGDLISALVGLAAGHLIGTPWLAGALAVGTAIAAMSLARCLHPPGGACALLCALGASGPDHWGSAVMFAIAANVLSLALFGWLYNNLTGHPWPHRAVQPPRPVAAAPYAGYTRADLEAVLAEWNEVMDIDVNDLDAIYQALGRRLARKAKPSG